LFKHVQGNIEKNLETLSELTEKDLDTVIDNDIHGTEFIKYKNQVINLNSLCHKFYLNFVEQVNSKELVTELETDLFLE